MSSSRTPDLAWVILADLWDFKWLIMLVVFVVMTAFSVVYTAHLTRNATAKLETLYEQEERLKDEYSLLLLEEQALAEPSRIHRFAEKQLGMARPIPESEIVIELQ